MRCSPGTGDVGGGALWLYRSGRQAKSQVQLPTRARARSASAESAVKRRSHRRRGSAGRLR
jgi:hypothetical protein